MRSSSRWQILDAALRVVDVVGGADITYESVAREAGLTKAGLMYHFPSKEELMIAVIDHVISRWQAELRDVLGVPFEQSTLAERVHAFVTFAGEGGVTKGEFVVFSEALRRPALSGPLESYLRDWFGFGESSDVTPLMLAWFAANGLWIAEATGIVIVSDAQRAQLLRSLAELTMGGVS